MNHIYKCDKITSIIDKSVEESNALNKKIDT
jgi:hypothetical protein